MKLRSTALGYVLLIPALCCGCAARRRASDLRPQPAVKVTYVAEAGFGGVRKMAVPLIVWFTRAGIRAETPDDVSIQLRGERAPRRWRRMARPGGDPVIKELTAAMPASGIPPSPSQPSECSGQNTRQILGYRCRLVRRSTALPGAGQVWICSYYGDLAGMGVRLLAESRADGLWVTIRAVRVRVYPNPPCDLLKTPPGPPSAPGSGPATPFLSLVPAPV